MQFGIYAGSGTGAGGALLQGKPDDAIKVQDALDKLQGKRSSFLVRCYVHYKGSSPATAHTPLDPKQYAVNGRKLDLVLCYQTHDDDMEAWCHFIEKIIEEYGDALGCLQITEETNVTGQGMDGDYPAALPALVAGVVAAKKALRQRGLTTNVGFNVTPMFMPNDYWQKLAALITPEFLQALDYVGLDFFPDVFRPIPFDKIGEMVEFVIQSMRERDLVVAGIPPTTPIHVTENGWPTGVDRLADRQADILEVIVGTVYKQRDRYNITAYEHFQLRDADSDSQNTYHHFGVMDDGYNPKSAFDAYCRLIAELAD